MANEIIKLLNTYHSATLQRMANAAGLEIEDKHGRKLKKTVLVNNMARIYFTAARIKAAWKKLSIREKEILNRLLLQGGTAKTQRFRREIIRAGLATPSPPPNQHRHWRRVPYAKGHTGHPFLSSSRVFEDVIARLTQHGLVFSRDPGLTSGGTSFKLQFHPGETLYVPEFVQRHLPEPTPIASQERWQPKSVKTGTPALLLRDLYLYWDFVRRNEVKLIKAGFVSKHGLNAINKILLVSDPLLAEVRREDETQRLYLLRQLLTRLNLVKKTDTHLVLTNTDPTHIPQFWSQPPVSQLRACLQAWPQLEIRETLSKSAASYRPRYAHAREAALTALKKMPADTWLDSEDFLEQMRDQDPNFLFQERSAIENYQGNWYYSSGTGYYYGSPKDLLIKLDALEIQFVSRDLFSFLYKIGVIELGYMSETQTDDQELYQGFRLTPLGRAILGLPADALPAQLTPAETGKLIIQPSFQLLAMGPVSLDMLAQLDMFSERENTDQGAFQYRLSREAVYQAQQLGMDVSQIIHFLENNSETALPQNVHRSLKEWAAHHERIVFRTGVSLLQAADATLLEDLLQTPSTSKHLARAITPTVALLKKGHQSSLINGLLERGLLPAVSGTDPQSADQSVIIQPDGSIHPIHAVPSLHLRGRLARVAQQSPNGHWQLTPQSIQKAGGDRQKVRHLLEELRRLGRGPLPQELVGQIKAWGSYYGQAAAETLTLIEFYDHVALKELREVSGLAERLTPFSMGERALAVVPTQELEQIKDILARFGVQVKDQLPR